MPLKTVWISHGQPLKWGSSCMLRWKQNIYDMVAAVNLILAVDSTEKMPAPETILHKVQLHVGDLVFYQIPAAVLAAIPELRVQKTETEWRIRLPFGFDRFYFPNCAPLHGLPKDVGIYVELGVNSSTEPKLTSAHLEIDMEMAVPRNNYKQFATFKTKYSGKCTRIEYPENDNVEAILVKSNQDPDVTQIKLLKGGHPTSWFKEEEAHDPTNQWIRFVAPKPTNTEELVIDVSHPDAQDCMVDVIYEIRVTE